MFKFLGLVVGGLVGGTACVLAAQVILPLLEKLNISLATQFAIKQLLIEKGIVSSLEP